MSNAPVKSFDDRKKTLIEEGALYRSRLTESTRVVKTNLTPSVIAHHAVEHVTSVAHGAFNNIFSVEGLKHGGWQKLMPLALTGISAIVRRRALVKPVLGGTLIVALLGTAAVFAFRNKKPDEQTLTSIS